MRYFLLSTKWLCIVLGCGILVINMYGLSQSMRPKTFFHDELRFGENDIDLSLDNYKQAVIRKPEESDSQYADRLTKVIARGTAHIHWEKYDPTKFNQRVPIWENWILYLMALYSGIPEFERYHFVIPEKSMERGIGICGEVSMLMTSLLEDNGIEARMLTFPGHVVVTARVDGNTKIFDPDFGVVIPFSAAELKDNVEAASQLYLDAGYMPYDKAFFLDSYSKPFTIWEGPEHFITKKYYFEKISYWFIWIVPLSLISIGFLLSQRISRKHC